ncbi:zinc-binding dehydrogenase [Paraburkholderia caribensis]|uniref:Alcohol dehydrogenase n=1 Tax=Paraburkholderia caribensis TaxID=75105 RepID=A0A9Q6WQ15_9BURK|nr:zinc-binding dehydrogenase [Paraburkholderia caribensis]MCO4878301.1 zinc-binding dehydrogenase [Paraburkholderia caribensis]PTB28605.1 alcohol dehydrogenase [Paraburkholderia caribensis]QLB66091.1 alcohol dehydrogenase [Paraburkholderia caribensis]
MKAVLIVHEDGSDKPRLKYSTVDDPVPGPNDLLVGVKSAGINRIDLQRSTAHGGPTAGKPLIAGLEIAGEVLELGRDVKGFKVGDVVMGMTTGAYAEKATIDHRLAMPIPEPFSFDQAVAVTTVYATAHNALVTNGRFRRGQTVLIQGAASAVGVATLQIAKAIGAGLVIGTGRSLRKGEHVLQLGLDRFLVKGQDSVTEEVARLTNDRGVDVVVDMVGGTALSDNLTSVALGGHIVNVGWMGGKRDELDLDTLARKRVTLVGVSFRTRTIEQKAELFMQFQKDVFPLFLEGKISPIIEKSYPLSEAEAAQDEIAQDTHLGKFLLHP